MDLAQSLPCISVLIYEVDLCISHHKDVQEMEVKLHLLLHQTEASG